MIGFFLPPVVAIVIGVVLVAVDLALLHSTLLAGLAILLVVVGGVRYMRGRSGNGAQR
jgi:hypothetical protein